MLKKKVLIITYYWSPIQNAGVHRWLHFSKILSEKNYDVHVYTAKTHSTEKDEGLEKLVGKNVTVIRKKIWEPYGLANFLSKKNKNYKKGMFDAPKNRTFLSSLSIFIRSNFFIPDARCFWIKPSTRFLQKYCEENKIDTLISTGPPHSMHRIAQNLKTHNPNLKWIADFRDPWTKIDYFKDLILTKWAYKKHHDLEKNVLQQADEVVTVSPSWAQDFEQICNRKVNVIENGFDELQYATNSLNKIFTLTYIGSLNQDRNPSNLWIILNDLLQKKLLHNTQFKVQLIGNIDPLVKSEITQLTYLNHVTEISAQIPHSKALKALTSSHLLLLLINNTANYKGIIPGKFFEYMGAERPILCLGKLGSDIEKIISQTQLGTYINTEDSERLKTTLLRYFTLYESKHFTAFTTQKAHKYNRKTLFEKYIQLIEKPLK